MGNTASNPRSNIPRTVPTSPAHQASPSTHKSLRTKKKSLELPDLAYLAITPNAPRPPPPSAPIPIPVSPRPNFHPRPQAVHDDSQFNMTDLLIAPPSTHVPLYLTDRRMSSARYSSTRSLSSTRDSPTSQPQLDSPFVPEIVRSTIPIALQKPLEHTADDDSKRRSRKEDINEAVSIKITWRGGGKNVILIRSGDDNWKGRQPMDKEAENTWVTWVSLFPGTHHLKFIVDDQVRIADDLPTAVDDEGSLANYVAVPFSPHSSPHSVSPPAHPPQVRHNSFWSESSSSAANNEGKWTSELPAELIAAAKEEEGYLASLSNSSTSQPAPNIPPAPVLPRHLDKLILNARASAASDREIQRDRRRKSNRAKEKVSSLTPSGSGNASPTSSSSDVIIPVTTASGTDVTATAQHTHPHATRSTAIQLSPGTNSGGGQLEASARMADDASVLPVPSHVVLRHLSTSAIKNGVLAVADTVRYKQKFITSIYYKPT